MILEKQKEANILELGNTQESIGMSLDLDSAQVLMQMLSKNLYSDAIGSTIRECASNALDSHRRAGVEDPIIVSFNTNDSNNYEFCVEDFGIGLDADDVKNIISKYGKSTKRNSNTELGMMGLGFKAPLAYSDSFYFVCRKNGVERKYMMYEGEDTNTIDLLHEAPTFENNGVKIIIPVKYNDRHDFIDKIKEQLAYFENVYFNITSSLYNGSIDNDFIIHRSTHFQFSELASDKKMHICLDNVYYPLDFDKLGIDEISVPIGLRFSLSDGLFPTPNRESLRYTPESKKTILNKIKNVADYCVNNYNSSIQDSDDALIILNHYKLNTREINLANKTLNVTSLFNYSDIKIKAPNLKNVKLLNLEKLSKLSDYIFNEYEIKFSLYYDRMSTIGSRHWSNKLNLNTINKYIYLYSESFTSNKKLYIKSICETRQTYKFAKKYRSFTLFSKDGDYSSYYKLLSLKDFPKSEWRQVIQEFQTVLKSLVSKTSDLDSVVIPQSWLDARKKPKKSLSGKKIEKLKGDVSCKKAMPLERYVDNQNCKFVSSILKLKECHKNKFLTIYHLFEEKEKLDDLYNIVARQNITLITVSQREYDKLEKVDIHNLMKYDEFIKGNNMPFKRIITAELIINLINSYRGLFNRKENVNFLSKNLGAKFLNILNYKNNNYNSQQLSTLLNKDVTYFIEANLIDNKIYNDYLDVKNFVEKYNFVNVLFETINYSNKEKINIIIVEMLKRHKFRLDFKNYLVKEELITE